MAEPDPRRSDPRPEFLMPVSDEGAALQFFVEAMKANTAVLQGIQAEQKETLRIMHDTRERVIRLESHGHADTIAANRAAIERLNGRIDRLESDRDRREGALSGVQGFIKIGPWLLSLVLGLLALAGWGQVK